MRISLITNESCNRKPYIQYFYALHLTDGKSAGFNLWFSLHGWNLKFACMGEILHQYVRLSLRSYETCWTKVHIFVLLGYLLTASKTCSVSSGVLPTLVDLLIYIFYTFRCFLSTYPPQKLFVPRNKFVSMNITFGKKHSMGINKRWSFDVTLDEKTLCSVSHSGLTVI